MTTPDGARTTYLYNEENLLSRIKYADGAVVRYTYDANGNRIGEEDENGAKTTFVYDALGRVVEVNVLWSSFFVTLRAKKILL